MYNDDDEDVVGGDQEENSGGSNRNGEMDEDNTGKSNAKRRYQGIDIEFNIQNNNSIMYGAIDITRKKKRNS